MAAGLLEVASQASIPTRTQIPPQIKAEVGSTPMDESCQVDSVGQLCMFVRMVKLDVQCGLIHWQSC